MPVVKSLKKDAIKKKLKAVHGQKDAIPGFPTNHAATLHEGSSANVVSGRAEAH